MRQDRNNRQGRSGGMGREQGAGGRTGERGAASARGGYGDGAQGRDGRGPAGGGRGGYGGGMSREQGAGRAGERGPAGARGRGGAAAGREARAGGGYGRAAEDRASAAAEKDKPVAENADLVAAGEARVLAAVARADEAFLAKMNDDFNTADAITAMFDLASEANRYLQEPVVTAAALEAILAQFARMDGVLGVLPIVEEGLLDADVERLIEERVEARKAKNWKRADEIRDELTAKGIILEDTPQGIRWRRK